MIIKIPLAVSLSFLSGVFVAAAVAQRPPPAVYVVDFMQVEPGGETEYVRLERELWKPVHEARIRDGTMREWSLFEVRYPAGTSRAYDFVTVNVFDSFADAERDPYVVFKEVHPDLAVEGVDEQTRAARELAHGELWYRLEHLD